MRFYCHFPSDNSHVCIIEKYGYSNLYSPIRFYRYV